MEYNATSSSATNIPAANNRVLPPKPPPRFHTSIEAHRNAFGLSSDEVALPPRPRNGLRAINRATLPIRNANLPGKPMEVIEIDSDSDEATKKELTDPPPKPAEVIEIDSDSDEAPNEPAEPPEAMQIDLYSTEAEREELKRAEKERRKQRKAARKARRPLKQLIHKAIPNSGQRQKFYEQHKNPDGTTLEGYLEEIRMKEIALRVMMEYCTTLGSATRPRVDKEVEAAPVAKSWFHDRSRFAERAPLREWELD